MTNAWTWIIILLTTFLHLQEEAVTWDKELEQGRDVDGFVFKLLHFVCKSLMEMDIYGGPSLMLIKGTTFRVRIRWPCLIRSSML